MLIRDWRQWPERQLDRRRSGDQTAGLDPWTRLVSGITRLRAGRRPAPAAYPAPLVVSVGNLSVGGSGKTPVTGRLALDLAATGSRVAILTRGYRSSVPGPLVVEPGDARCGDEARLMASWLERSDCRVIQSRVRSVGLAFISSLDWVPDVLLLEDAHQTAGVGRHLDILILGSWATDDKGVCVPCTGRALPWGAWREGVQGAERARVWLLENDGVLPGSPPGHQVTGFRRMASVHIRREAGNPDAAWVCVSGIARPEVFEREAERLWARPLAACVRFGDHEGYRDYSLRRLLELVDRVGAGGILTTAKDRVKLEERLPKNLGLAILEQELAWSGATALPELVRERLRCHKEGVGQLDATAP